MDPQTVLHAIASSCPFQIEGAPNVMLETIKRGVDDESTGTEVTVILRLFERMGGHADATLVW